MARFVVEKINNCSRKIQVVLPYADYDVKRKQKFKELQKNVEISGFRPGKIPVVILQKEFGKTVHDEILNALVDDTLDNIINESGLVPSCTPEVTFVMTDDFADIEYIAEFEVLPEYELPDVSKLSIVEKVIDITEQDVDKCVDWLCLKYGSYHEVMRPVKALDEVHFYYQHAAKNNLPVTDKNGQEDFTVIGKQGWSQELSAALLGKSIGDTITVDLHNYQVDIDAKGFTGTMKLTISAIKELVKATIADMLMDKNFIVYYQAEMNKLESRLKSVDQLREWCKQLLLDEAQAYSLYLAKDQIYAQLRANDSIILGPNTMKSREASFIELKVEERTRLGISTTLTEDDLSEIKADAITHTMIAFWMEAVISKYQLTVTDDEIIQEITRIIADDIRSEEYEYVDYMNNENINSEDVIEKVSANAKFNVMSKKVIQKILSLAKVTKQNVVMKAVEPYSMIEEFA